VQLLSVKLDVLENAVFKAKKDLKTIDRFLTVQRGHSATDEANINLNQDFIAGLQDRLNDVVKEARAVKRQRGPVLRTLRKALMKE